MAMAVSSYGGQNMGQNMMMMRTDMGSSNSLVALMSCTNPHGAFQVPKMSGGLEDAIAGCGQNRPYYPTFDGGALEEPDEDADEDMSLSHPVEKKRRLSFDQVRSLERSFEMENKLEPERKMQLSKDLGLQPRQVAVWFQNRRARWKTKQLERDYEMLNSGFVKLKAEYEAALEEKDALKAEVERISGKPSANQESQSVDSTQCTSELAHCNPPTGPSEAQPKCAPNIEVCKEKEDSTVNSSSELLDADSPHTTSSNHLSGLEEDLACEFPPESFVGPGGGFSMKPEEECGFQVDPSCNYFLPPMMERGVLPWWDWA